jgi:hypothetical protein
MTTVGPPLCAMSMFPVSCFFAILLFLLCRVEKGEWAMVYQVEFVAVRRKEDQVSRTPCVLRLMALRGCPAQG